MRFLLLLLLVIGLRLSAAPTASAGASPWARERLAAWCIVPFDAAQRGPVERARLLQELGLTKLAYDYREEHIPTFEAEIAAMRDHGIEIVAWWFPATLDDTARHILDVLARTGLRPQLWVSGWEHPASGESEEAFLDREAARIREIATAAARIGCTVGLYNHGGWFGEPLNQLAIIDRLAADGIENVGLIYNFHHAHDQIERFAGLWPRMRDRVLAVNLNGMVPGGDEDGRKILPLGAGTAEADMMRVIAASGWAGLVGLLDHQPELDARVALEQNLRGLDRLRRELAAE